MPIKGDERAGGKSICFLFPSTPSGFITIYKRCIATVQDQMTHLMEKRKPEMIIRKVPKAHNDHCFIGTNEPACATCATPGRRTHEDESDTGRCTYGTKVRNKTSWIFSLRKSPKLRDPLL